MKRPWFSAPIICTYTLSGPVRREISFEFHFWLWAPPWVNGVLGWTIAQRCFICAWWLRLVDYGTPSEKCASIVWFMMLAAKLSKVMT